MAETHLPPNLRLERTAPSALPLKRQPLGRTEVCVNPPDSRSHRDVVTRQHFCSCTDLKCPLNPSNPNCRQKTCDGCIRKCLKAGEIPACFFKDVHPDTSSWTDYSYAGFCRYLAVHSWDAPNSGEG